MDLQIAQNRKYIAVLALAACVILAFGWLLRPREVANSPAPLPSENELAQLARRAERRSLDNMTTFFAVTADDLESSIVQLPANGASGVVWAGNTIVTGPLPRNIEGTLTIQSVNGEGRGEPFIWGPRMPLAAISPDEDLTGLNAVRPAAALPDPGAWVLAVWRAGRERRFAPGSYLQAAVAECQDTEVQELVSSLALSPPMVGGGLFDIDGSLLGVIVPCDDRLTTISASSIASIVESGGTDAQRLLARYGLVLETLSDDEQAFFRVAAGVFVREVWTGYRGEQAGLAPGDVIVELNDTPLAAPADLAPLVAPSTEAPMSLRVRRGARTITIQLATAAPTSETDTLAPAGAGLVWEAPSQSYGIDSVVPGSRADTAGIQPGDRLVSINHAAPRSLAQVQQLFASSRALPALVEVERGDRRIAILVR